MLNPRLITISPEDFFAQRYGRMLEWSLHLTGGDRAAAEDLLHDLFLLFTLRQPDFESIENVEGYLYTMLRNLHLSQLRRATRAGLRQLSIVEFDSAELGLRAADPQARLQARDELRRVCEYVCVRKEKSKTASVLILRFFHGYYPSEIVRLLKVSRKAVDIQLLTARNEVKLFLERPAALSLLGEKPPASGAGDAPLPRADDDALAGLREMIFRSRRGECLSPARIRGLYLDGGESVACEPLAHLVSCPVCLDAANTLLGLPSLAERYPMDTLIRDVKKKGGGDDDGGTAGGGGGDGTAARHKLRRWRREAGEVFEHKPSELCISVNGYAQGSRRVSSEFNDMRLVLDLAEPIKFVEVFSEQQTRLLFLNVELPPAGPCVQPSQVLLSDGRTLDLALEFRSPWPTVQLIYHDPALATPDASPVDEGVRKGLLVAGPRPAPVAGDEGEGLAEPGGLRGGPFRRLLASFDRPFWLLRPGFVSAFVALALVAALLFVRMSVPAVSAAELLDRTLAAEEQAAADDSTVVHRTMQLEERDAGGGSLIARRRIETWRSQRRGATVRRLYDQGGRLLAVEWRRADGSRTVYRLPGEGDSPQGNVFEDAWLVDPSARDFKTLVGDGARARVEEERERYVIAYRGEADGGADGVVAATLTISRAASRATAQTLVLRKAGEAREYRFVETGFDLRPAAAVPPSAFEPDGELMKVGVTRTTVAPPAASEAGPASAAEPRQQPAHATVTATSELEVEVLRLLNQVGADLGEQINVTRTPGGRLRVHGVVETQERRVELLRSLAALSGNSAVEVEVSTASEVLRSRAAARPTHPPVVHQVAPAEDQIPAEEELRRHYSKDKGLSDEEAHAASLQLAGRASQRSMLALQHAWAMKRLAARFPDRELRALDPAAREKWLSMMQSHARAVRRESTQLRQELQPIFPGAGGDAPGVARGDAGESGLARAAERLLGLCSATDKGVRLAFTASPEGARGTALTTAQFWRDLRQVEGLASWVEGEAQRMRSVRAAPAAAPSPKADPEEKDQ
jgi:DNA-directed RNA polymerase specialized sigma24 family protein